VLATRLYNDLTTQLVEGRGLALVWTLLGEKQILSEGGDSPGSAVIGDAFRLSSDGVEGNIEYFPKVA
jgi:hypothetical protein